jgi:hypothetical protein
MIDTEFAREQPVLAGAVAIVVATLGYAGVTVAFGRGAQFLEGLVFGVMLVLVCGTAAQLRGMVGTGSG